MNKRLYIRKGRNRDTTERGREYDVLLLTAAAAAAKRTTVKWLLE